MRCGQRHCIISRLLAQHRIIGICAVIPYSSTTTTILSTYEPPTYATTSPLPRPPLISYAPFSAARAQQAQTQSCPPNPRPRRSSTATPLVSGYLPCLAYMYSPRQRSLTTRMIPTIQLSSPSHTAPTASPQRPSSARRAQRPTSSSSTKSVRLSSKETVYVLHGPGV